MPLDPNFEIPDYDHEKWNDIEYWRRHNIPTLTAGILPQGCDLANWSMINVTYDDQYDRVTSITWRATNSEEFKIDIRYDASEEYVIEEIDHYYRHMPYRGIFEKSAKGTLYINYIVSANYYTTYAWGN